MLETSHSSDRVKNIQYISSDYHRAIGLSNTDSSLAFRNIGENGYNLTICVLLDKDISRALPLFQSLNNSIPSFRGHLLIGLCNCQDHDIEQIKVLTSHYNSKIINLCSEWCSSKKKNYLFSQVQTEWIMMLSHNLVFTSNPLSKIEQDIAQMGVHFLGLSFKSFQYTPPMDVIAYHLCLDVQDNIPVICLSPIRETPSEQTSQSCCLCTGFFIDASVFNKITFFKAGGFDEQILSYGTDEIFSMKLFQQGYKVGFCSETFLEFHPSESQPTPVSIQQIQYLLSTYGVILPTPHSLQEGSDSKIRIALVPDKPGWAFDNITKELVRHLSDEFEFKIIYAVDIDNIADVLIVAKDCDLVHVFWRGFLAAYTEPYAQNRIKNLGLTRAAFEEKYVSGKIFSTEVYDHLLLDDDESYRTPQLFIDNDSLLTNYAVCSWKLQKIYNNLPNLRLRPKSVLPDGVDLSLFAPCSLERFSQASLRHRAIRFGWVGNSKWTLNDLKGIASIIKPAIQQLQQEGYWIDLYTSDRQDKLIPHEEMPTFYNGIDCYICASIHEGTPNPVLEAMACGVPVISTDVGLIPELFGPLQKEFILEERSVQCLVQKIKKLLADPAQFARLSQENLQFIKKWDWRIMAENFRTYFKACLDEQKKSQSAALDK